MSSNRPRGLAAHGPALAVLAALAIYRATLLGTGAFSWLDESYYNNAAAALDALSRGAWREAAAAVVAYARPLAVLVWLLPVWGQALLAEWRGIGIAHPESALLPAALNVTITFGLGLAYYRACLLLLGGRTAATVAVALYGTLASSNVYVRHVVPYDLGLLLVMILLAAGLRARRPGPIAACGLLWGAAVSAYPAVHPAAAATALAVTFAPRGALRDRLRRLALLVGPMAAVLLGWELLARWAGRSYVAQARLLHTLHARVLQGSFDEGYSFLPRYLVQVDGVAGAAVLALALAYAVHRIWRSVQDAPPRPRCSRALDLVLVCMAAAWWMHAFASAWLRAVFFTGRYVHAYVPFVVCAAVASVGLLPRPWLRAAGHGALALLAVASLVLFDRSYRRLAYPIDMVHAGGLDYDGMAGSRRAAEVTLAERFTAAGVAALSEPPAARPPYREMEAPPPEGAPWLLVNVGVVADRFEQLPPVEVPAAAELLRDAPHFCSFRAYQFEYLEPRRRAQLHAMGLRMRVYRLPASR